MKPTEEGYLMLAVSTLVNSVILAILVWRQFLGG